MSKFKSNRVAYFGDENNPTKVNLAFEIGVPFINLSDKGGSSELAGMGDKYPQSVKKVTVNAKPQTLDSELYYIDENGVKVDDRYTFMAEIPSVFTNAVSYLYHDSYEKDLFLVPDTELYVGDTDSDEYVENNEISIGVTMVGSYSSQRGMLTELIHTTLPNLKSDRTPVETVKDVNNLDIYLMSLPGLNSNGHFNNAGYVASNEHYYESKRHTIIQLVSLGSTSDLMDDDAKVKLHKIISPRVSDHKLTYIGEYKCSDLLIPITY